MEGMSHALMSKTERGGLEFSAREFFRLLEDGWKTSFQKFSRE